MLTQANAKTKQRATRHLVTATTVHTLVLNESALHSRCNGNAFCISGIADLVADCGQNESNEP